MVRGFLGGVLWGGLLVVAVAGLVSVLAPSPVPTIAPQVSDASPEVANPPETVVTVLESAQDSASESVPLPTSPAPRVDAPAADTVTLDTAVTTPGAAPETGPAAVLDTPAESPENSDVAVVADAPVLPAPQALAPMEPPAADALVISTQPAAPPAPEAVVDVPQTVEETSPVQDAPPTVVAEAPAPSQEDTSAEVQAAPVAQDTVVPVAPEAPATLPETETETAAIAPAPEVTPVDPPASVTSPAPQAPEADIAPAPQEDSSVDVAAADTSQSSLIGRPAVPLTERGTSTVTIRRPSSSTLGQVDDGATAEIAVAADADSPADPRPIARYAQSFDNPEAKPLMSIVLIDDGTSPVAGSAGIAALRSFPYPLSFAVDSSLRDAADRMALYRAEGFEVLAMVDLPQGAQPTDAETTLGAILPTLPEVVGVLEGTGAGLQGNRQVADQVTSILAQTGHGLLTQDNGLNTMPKLARREGVPADPIFRDFDSKGQSPQVIRRFLDQAAFRAGQEGAVVMLGRLRPDTISALLLWGLQDRAGKVALAPISAVLRREEG